MAILFLSALGMEESDSIEGTHTVVMLKRRISDTALTLDDKQREVVSTI